jgi:hypothetical protein
MSVAKTMSIMACRICVNSSRGIWANMLTPGCESVNWKASATYMKN